MQVFVRVLGYVLVRQPTVILRVSSQRKKVNAWMYASRTTDRDPASVILDTM